jgi:hypothetical protein
MLSEMLIITLQNCIAELGFMPDKYGVMVKNILKLPDFPPDKLALGCYLDKCMKDKSYLPLDDLKKEIDSRKPI